MTVISDSLYRLRVLFRRREMDAELAAELEHHVSVQAERYVANGLNADEARRRALVDIGGVELVKENTRDVRGTTYWDTAMQDLRYAIRSLLRAPSFTVAAIVALGLGIGSATAVFSLLEGVVLRELPYKHPQQLVSLWETNNVKGLNHELMSPVNFTDYRALTGVFSDMAGWWRTQLVLNDAAGADASRVSAVEVTANFFTMLGVSPKIGHTFDGDSLQRAKSNQVMISERLWQTKFNSDAAIVGKSIRLNGEGFAVVGVMPASFNFPAGMDVWQGLTWDLHQHSRTAHFWEGIARLAPGVTEDRANRELGALTARLGQTYAATNGGRGARVVRLDREIVGTFRPALFALLGASSLLLLIACINVANLLLARGATRRREVALRSAIGANRSRIVRLLLTESVILAVGGTLLGFVIAFVAVRGLLAWSPVEIPRAGDVAVNGWVLAFSATVTVLTAIAFGLAPALSLAKADPIDALRNGTKGSGSRAGKTRGALVMAEVALAVMLLSGASLVVRSVSQLLHEDIGINPQGAFTAELQLAGDNYKDYATVTLFYDRLLTALRARPEVAAAGIGYYLPLDVAYRLAYTVYGAPRAASDEPLTAQFHSVDEGFLGALQTRFIKGRTFTPQ